MGQWQLLMKDVREHGLALASLLFGFLLVTMVALEQQKSGAFSMSRIEVVRFSLITILPLIAFIVGNRLIVREYVGGTRQFVEALPIKTASQLIIKWLLGIVYLLFLAGLAVILAAGSADAAEAIDGRYISLLMIKTLAITTLFWSIAFFVSFTGRLRLFLYVILGLGLMFVINMPGIDESRFPPIALMERELFVFERELFPMADLIATLAIAALFVVAAFVLALVNDGSLAEQLGKPISRRDMAAFAILGMGCLTVYTTLQKKWETENYSFSGEAVLRNDNPAIAVSYLDDRYKEQATRILETSTQMLAAFQSDIGIDAMPQVQIAMNTDLEHTEMEPELLDGVLLSANFAEYGEFEHGMLNSIAMHHLLLSLTNGRWDYESRHWLLDGLARWWSEEEIASRQFASGDSGNRPDLHRANPNRNELFALAAVANARLTTFSNPLLIWQTVTDKLGFEAADALSYTAILYLEQERGRETVIKLAADYVNEVVGESSVESVRRLLNLDVSRFSSVAGIEINTFVSGWREWLQVQASEPAVKQLIDAVPRVSATVSVVRTDSGNYNIVAEYAANADYIDTAQGVCVLRHQSASAFDLETMIYERRRDRQPCTTEGATHKVDSPYAPGDRLYVALEFESELFHRPIPMWLGRIQVK